MPCDVSVPSLSRITGVGWKKMKETRGNESEKTVEAKSITYNRSNTLKHCILRLHGKKQ